MSGGHIPKGDGPHGPPPNAGSSVIPPARDDGGLREMIMQKFADSDRKTIGIVKAILWEDAKGRLRSVAELSGQQPASPEGVRRYEAIRDRIEAFIRDFEDEGMQEP